MSDLDIERLPRIHSVFVFGNGMCAVTDWDGKQVPELQGEWDEVKEVVRAAVLHQGNTAALYGANW